jgi:hypothetical protein
MGQLKPLPGPFSPQSSRLLHVQVENDAALQ